MLQSIIDVKKFADKLGVGAFLPQIIVTGTVFYLGFFILDSLDLELIHPILNAIGFILVGVVGLLASAFAVFFFSIAYAPFFKITFAHWPQMKRNPDPAIQKIVGGKLRNAGKRFHGLVDAEAAESKIKSALRQYRKMCNLAALYDYKWTKLRELRRKKIH